MKSTEQALSEALNAGVTGALGALQFQVIALTAERDVLKAQLAVKPAIDAETYEALRDAVAWLGGIKSDNVPESVRRVIARAQEPV